MGLGFNGAATFRPRKPPQFHRVFVRMARFNGAATFRPRKPQGRAPRGSKLGASMGPRPFGRGNVRNGVLSLISDLLQWGRDLSAAETSHTTFSFLPASGRLQWGRDLSAAETTSVKVPEFEEQLASMGPRPFGRGNADCRGHPPHDVLLQWGRDLSAAETRMIHDVSLGTLRFNGAATFQPRKPALLVSILLPQNGASMGPRPFSRGNLDILTALLVRQRKLQWGRDLSAAET